MLSFCFNVISTEQRTYFRLKCDTIVGKVWTVVDYSSRGPRGLTFTWWGCCRLWLWRKPTKFAHWFLFRSCVCFCLYVPFNCISFSPNGLTFMWWGCCDLCLWYKPTGLAHSFLFCSCVCFCLYGPFNCISFHKFSKQLSACSLCSAGLFLPYWSFQLYISLWKFSSALI